ncbi:MAG: zinc-ribbon domain-containing protein [Desulfovibrionaceae bacterium]|jgi:predicted Zn finger-like uncharacterized protein|nr:zinc-ribbon domain-containing protein [Desulfovibrionaceae bacterium]
MQIICPNCQFAREVPEDKLPPRAVVATCPRCKEKFKFRELPPEDEFLIEEPEAAATPDEPAASDASAARSAQDAPDAEPAAPAEPVEPTAQDVWQRLEAMTPPDGFSDRAADRDADRDADADAPPEAPSEPAQAAEPAQPAEPWRAPDARPQSHADQDASRDRASGHADADTEADPFGPGWAAADAHDHVTVDVPWERMDRYGFFPGLFQTIRRGMLSAPLFFQTMPLNGALTRPLAFAVLLNLFAFLCEFAWDRLGLPQLWLQTSFSLPETMAATDLLMLMAVLPALLVLGVFINAAVCHLFLLLVRAGKSGFEGTFRAVCYGAAPMVLNAVPYVGPVVAMSWSLIVTFIGLKQIHRTSFPRLALALLLPVVFVLGVLLLASLHQPPGGPLR